MLLKPFYDPNKSYYENFDEGPFNGFADGKVFENLNNASAAKEAFSHKVFTPIGIPAGPLVNSRFVNAALDKGFDIPIYKTVRTKEKKSHPWPNVLPIEIEGDLTLEKAQNKLISASDYNEPLSITNSFGVPSFGPDFWQPDVKKSVEHTGDGQIVGLSIEGTKWEGYDEDRYIGDWVLCAKLAKETGAHFIEANLSCPNEGTTALLCFDAKKVRRISEAIKNEVGNFPLALKISYFSSDESLKDFVKEIGNIVDGIAAINTISAEIVDRDGRQALPGEGRLRSGVCGTAIKWAGLDMVRRLKNLRDEAGLKYEIIGVGGIFSPPDFKEYLDAGADIAMSATGAMWNPYLAKEIKAIKN